MLRVCVLLLAGLTALAACHSGPRAVIVASRGDGAATPRCLDGSTRTSPAYQRICESVSRGGAKRAAAARLRPSVAGVEPVAAIRVSVDRPSRASDERSEARLLLPAAYTRSPSRTEAGSEATPSFEERMRVRSRLLPPIVLPEIIDISGVLQALRGSVG